MRVRGNRERNIDRRKKERMKGLIESIERWQGEILEREAKREEERGGLIEALRE